LSYTTVGHLLPNEVFLNLASDTWCFNHTSEEVPVFSSPEPFEANGVSYRHIYFLHTSYPTDGYIETSILGHLANYNWGTFDNEYKILKLAVESYAYCWEYGDSNEFHWVPAGAKILVKDGSMYSDGTYTKMCIYGWQYGNMPSNEWYMQDPHTNGGMGYLYTNIKTTSAKGKFSVDWNLG
jgi:hypothetical protein